MKKHTKFLIRKFIKGRWSTTKKALRYLFLRSVDATLIGIAIYIALLGAGQ